MDHQFRNAAIGGFHKQDVLDYLELIAREHQEQFQRMQQELDQAQQQLSDQLAKENVRDAQTVMQEQEIDRLRRASCAEQGELEQAQSRLAQAQEENAALRAQLEEKGAAIAQLQQEADKLRPDAEAYAAVKERAAGIELDAHRRAQGILDQARNEAQQLHAQTQEQVQQRQEQVQQWLGRVSREYGDLRTQMDATVSHAAEELKKAGQLLEQVTQCLNQQDAAMEDLEQSCPDCPAARVPAPMPIPEE